MSGQLTSKLIETEFDDRTIWSIEVDENRIALNGYTDCYWLDDDQLFVGAMYREWESTELWAIVNLKGEVVRNAIRSIEYVLNDRKLFIVEMSGFGMEDEARQYDLEDDDWKMAVVDRVGRFVIPPVYQKIYFDEVDTLFVADNNRYELHRFNLDGTIIPAL